MFKVGQRVVCIDDDWSHEPALKSNIPRSLKDAAYVVEGVHSYGGEEYISVVDFPYVSCPGYGSGGRLIFVRR